MDTEENLDALLSALSDDEDEEGNDSFDDAICNLVDDEISKLEDTGSSNNVLNDSKTNENKIKTEEPKIRRTAEGDDNKVSEMEAKLQQMQEEMRKMQEQLLAAKHSQQLPVKPEVQTKNKTLEEIDVFQASTSRSVANAPRSPVKSNPFAEADKPRKIAQFHPETPVYGPSLSKKSTRVLSKEETVKLNLELKQQKKNREMIAIARGDLADSSDDDMERDDPTMEKYNSYGKEIRRIAKASASTNNSVQSPSLKGNVSSNLSSNQSSAQKPLGFNQMQGSVMNLTNQSANRKLPSNMIIEKHSKLRIANPVISQMSLDLSLMGRKMISMHRIRTAIMMRETDGDWTTIGVVYNKMTQKSKNGNTYTMWKMSDLSGDIETVTILLFGRANTKHYSMPVNKVVGLLNPKILEDRSGKGELSLSVDHPDKIMEMGDAIDCGTCKATKANGGNCTNIVNLNSCEFCVFHVKKAYKAMSSNRSALQSSFSGGDSRSRIMAKIAPKGEVFAGGQILNQPRGLPGKKSIKNIQKDQATLSSLGIKDTSSMLLKAQQKKASDNSVLQRLNQESSSGKLAFKSQLSDSEKNVVRKIAQGSEELGMKLLAPTPGSRLLMKHLTRDSKEELEKNKTIDEIKALKKSKIIENQLGAKKLLMETKQRNTLNVQSPKLGRGMSSGFISLEDVPPSNKSHSVSKAAAILALKGKTLNKKDPNYVSKRKRSEEEVEESKRKITKTLNKSSTENDQEEIISGNDQQKPKKQVIRSFTGEIMDESRLEELRNRKSINQNLANVADLEQQEEYFNRAEKKEAMEEKMINTKEIEAKIVTCKICNYSAYKQSEHCKASNHFVKVVKAKKRFFECKSCKNRTYSFDKLPKHACSKCQSSTWIRTGMIREKKGPLLDNEKLLIRGQEESFIGAVIKSSDLQL